MRPVARWKKSRKVIVKSPDETTAGIGCTERHLTASCASPPRGADGGTHFICVTQLHVSLWLVVSSRACQRGTHVVRKQAERHARARVCCGGTRPARPPA